MRVACLQLNSTCDLQANMQDIAALVAEACAQGAEFIATPENSTGMIQGRARKLELIPFVDDHPGFAFFSDLAQQHECWLLIGSMPVKLTADRIANRSILFAPDGSLAAQYDKIHMFDVDLPTGESHRESETVQPGNKAVIAQTPWGGVGMSICYDLRFPHLYRHLAQSGADILAVPAAFTVPTGRAHWEALLRARAIENGAYVLAPAQVGEHDGGRKTYGHSLIINPWGDVMADAGGDDVGMIMADLDMNAVTVARQAIPSLQHDRSFS